MNQSQNISKNLEAQFACGKCAVGNQMITIMKMKLKSKESTGMMRTQVHY